MGMICKYAAILTVLALELGGLFFLSQIPSGCPECEVTLDECKEKFPDGGCPHCPTYPTYPDCPDCPEDTDCELCDSCSECPECPTCVDCEEGRFRITDEEFVEVERDSCRFICPEEYSVCLIKYNRVYKDIVTEKERLLEPRHSTRVSLRYLDVNSCELYGILGNRVCVKI